MDEHEIHRQATQSVIYVDAGGYKELLKDTNYFRESRMRETYGDSVGYWLTSFGRIKVILLSPKCDTCTNYIPKTIIGSAEL